MSRVAVGGCLEGWVAGWHYTKCNLFPLFGTLSLLIDFWSQTGNIGLTKHHISVNIWTEKE